MDLGLFMFLIGLGELNYQLITFSDLNLRKKVTKTILSGSVSALFINEFGFFSF